MSCPKVPRCEQRCSACNEIDKYFSNAEPNLEERAAIYKISEAARQCAQVIIANSPACADRTAALRKLREALAAAEAAVIFGAANQSPPPIPLAPTNLITRDK